MVETWNSDPVSNFLEGLGHIFLQIFQPKVYVYLLKGASTVPSLNQASSEFVHYCQHECVNS